MIGSNNLPDLPNGWVWMSLGASHIISLPAMNSTASLKKLNTVSLVSDQIEKDVEQNLKRAERLRQSILKRVFEGTLRSTQVSLRETSDMLRTLCEMCLKIIGIGGKCYG